MTARGRGAATQFHIQFYPLGLRPVLWYTIHDKHPLPTRPMKNRDISVGVCSAVVGVMLGVVVFSSSHGSFSLSASAVPLVAVRYDDGLHGAAYQYIKRHVSDVPFFNVPKDKVQEGSAGSGSIVVPTLCETVTTITGDIKDVVKDTIPEDVR